MIQSNHNNQDGEKLNWLDRRFPLTKVIKEHLTEYYAPRNFNFWYAFGAFAILVLVIQLLSGVFLAMYYKPDAEIAFNSVEFIMRDVEWGWFIRYLHSTGASAFFLVVYLHMFRGLLYGSYKKPRELVWVLGTLLLILLMAEAFMGYVLPWGQMSYWGAQVIISLFETIPFIGHDLKVWILGDFAVGDVALNRFFALHIVVLPLLLIFLIFLHIVALHHVGSNNPDGIEIKENKDKDGIPKDGIPFHPYYTVKDTMLAVVFLIVYLAVVFFVPDFFGYFLERDNFIEADPLKTPEHIAPLWYLTPFYSMLRAVPPLFGSQFPGVLCMFLGLLVWLFMPWLDRGGVKSIRYRGNLYRSSLFVFVISFLFLMWLGMQAVTEINQILARIFTITYFGFFALMPWISRYDKCTTVPDRVT